METRFNLPGSFRPLLWSYDFDRIDPTKHKKLLITASDADGDLDQTISEVIPVRLAVLY